MKTLFALFVLGSMFMSLAMVKTPAVKTAPIRVPQPQIVEFKHKTGKFLKFFKK